MSFLLGLMLGICVQPVFTFYYHIIHVSGQPVTGLGPASSPPSYRDVLTAPIRRSFFWVMSFSLGLMLGFMSGIEPVHVHVSITIIHALTSLLPYPLLTSHVSLVHNRRERIIFS